jgi:hypothetical protein
VIEATEALGQQCEDLLFVSCRLTWIDAIPASVSNVQQQLLYLVVADIPEHNQHVCRDAHLRLQFTGHLQFQFLLGHRSVETTERYLGSRQRIVHVVNDKLGISPDRDPG